MLDLLNRNNGAINVFFSGVVAFSTLIYAFLTWKLVSETRRMREVQTEPKVSANALQHENSINIIDLVIQNIGLGPAYEIKFKVNPDFKLMKGKLSDTGLVKSGLNYLAPNQKIQFFLTHINAANFEEKMKIEFKIVIDYQNSLGRTYTDEYLINFSQFNGLDAIEGSVHQLL